MVGAFVYLRRLRDDGRIFAVTVESQTHYRAFQFEHGQPKVVFSTLVSAGGKHRSGWGMVVWRDAPNRWLDGCILVEFITRFREGLLMR